MTHMQPQLVMLGGCVCSKLTVSPLCFSVRSCMHVRLFLFRVVCYRSNNFLLELVVRLQSPTISLLFPPSLSPSVCCRYALCSAAAIQFRRIPSGIQLKFLPNNQLAKRRQTACLLSSSASCWRLSIIQKSGRKLNLNISMLWSGYICTC